MTFSDLCGWKCEGLTNLYQNATLANRIDRLERKEQAIEDSAPQAAPDGESEMLIDPPPDDGEKMK